MIIKTVLVISLLIIIYNLFKALFTMLKDDSEQPKMSKYLGRRVLFSGFVIILLLIAMATGLINPNPRPY